MAPLIVLVIVILLARAVGQLRVPALRDWAACTRIGLAAMLCFTAVAHFNSMRPDLIAMVPPLVPDAGLAVTLTGICEILGGIGLLVPRTRRVAAVALILFLIAILPANIHAARAGVTIGGAQATPVVPRVLVQAVFIGLVWWSGIHRAGTRGQTPTMATV